MEASGRGIARVVAVPAADADAAAFYYMHNSGRGPTRSTCPSEDGGYCCGNPISCLSISIWAPGPATRLLFIRLHRLGHESAKLMPSKLMVQFEWLDSILISATAYRLLSLWLWLWLLLPAACSVILPRLAPPRQDCKIFQLILEASALAFSSRPLAFDKLKLHERKCGLKLRRMWLSLEVARELPSLHFIPFNRWWLKGQSSGSHHHFDT